MQSIPAAVTWELFRRGRWSVSAAFLGAVALPLLLFSALTHEGALPADDPSMLIVHIVLLQICMMVLGSAVVGAQGSPARLYTYPIPTSTIVTWHLLPAMALMWLGTVAMTAFLNLLFPIDWPVWGPALFGAVVTAAVLAILWFTEKSGWLFVGLTTVAGLLGIWFKARYGPVFGTPNRMWIETTPVEVATMFGIAGCAFLVAVAGVGRNRCSEPLRGLGIIAWLQRVLDPPPEFGPPFRSPAEAQFHFEWRRKGWILPAVVIFGVVFALVAWLLFNRNPQDLYEGFFAGGGLLCVAAIVGGAMLGNTGPSDSSFEMGHFQATRPITNADLAGIVLRMIAKSVLSAWLIWAACFLVLVGILAATNSVTLQFPEGLGWWYFPVTIVGPWLVASLLASIGLTGRSRPFVELFCGSMAVWIIGIVVSKFTLSDSARAQLANGITAACGIAFVVGTLTAYVAAWRRALIGPPIIYAAAGLWLATGSLAMIEFLGHPTRPVFSVYVFLGGLLSLAVAPFATAPLAVAWNRNR